MTKRILFCSPSYAIDIGIVVIFYMHVKENEGNCEKRYRAI